MSNTNFTTGTMKRTIKSIGVDLHISSATFTTLNKDGKLLEKRTMALNEKEIGDYISTIRGRKQLAVEEGPLAEWFLNFAHNKVDELIVCDPKKNALIYKGNSNDDIDSYGIAELLRLNSLKKVVHPLSKDRQEFREIMNLYFKVQKDTTRYKNRLKAVFRKNGIPCAGTTIYNEKKKKDWIKKLPKKAVSIRCANVYWDQIALLRKQTKEIVVEMKKRVKTYSEIGEFMKIKGVGLITACTYSAFIFTPFRFSKKSRLVSYCSLSLVENDTGKLINKQKEKKRRKIVLKRLTNEGNRKLKSKLKNAAQCACHQCKKGELKEKYIKLINRGLDSDRAILTVTRYLAIKLWGIWKKVERAKHNKQLL